MRILYLGNNRLGWQVLEWLVEQGENIIGLVLHPPEKRKYGNEILDCASVDPQCVFDASRLNQSHMLEAIRKLQADMALSVLFGYILPEAFIEMFPKGVVNLHPAYLPYNRGEYPNVWSIVENTPAGATLHYVDSGIDTGDIIARKKIVPEPVDTGESLYHKLERLSLELFKETWLAIRSGRIAPRGQDCEAGSFHRAKDVEKIDLIDLDKRYSARELIDILRARTFPPYPGAYFLHNGRKVYLRLTLFYEDQLENDDTS